MGNITKKFFDRFKKEQGDFLLCVEGIDEQGDRERYTLLMLKRLIFLVFLQQKGFLDGDKNYLYNRLKMVQEQYRQKPLFSFYRDFLLKLFHDGLNKRERSAVLEQLLGNVPYLKSDLFAVHMLERDNPHIQIPDSTFEKLL